MKMEEQGSYNHEDRIKYLEEENTQLKSALREAYPWVEDYRLEHPEWCNYNSIEPRCNCGEVALLQIKIAWLEKHKGLMSERAK